MENLEVEIKTLLIDALGLEDITVDDIKDDEALFGEGLGLDSIDALELIVLLDKQYGIKLADPKAGKEVFKSVQVMAEYIQQHRTK